MLLKNILILVICVVSLSVQAQELQCSVSVVSPSIQATNKQVYETMQTAIYEFMNGQVWTDNTLMSEERLECSILININEVVSDDEFSGTIQIQARRPVYNSSYSSVMLNYLDQDFSFEYKEFESLIFNPNSYDSGLVGVLSYYAYMMLGFDYDSFAKLGGTEYLEMAEKIVSLAQNSSQSGWHSSESRRNRYWLVENYLNEYHKPMREGIYQYHRLGLDKMTDKPESGRKEVLSALEKLQKVFKQRPGTFAMAVFFDAKADELINIFSKASEDEQKIALEVLEEINPSNSSKYEKSLTQNK